MSKAPRIRIGILGGGPSGLFMYKRLIDSAEARLEVHIFERKDMLGAGFPYSLEGSGTEHVTNVSGNEIPELEIPLQDWIESLPDEVLRYFKMSKSHFTDFKVVPRLLFGMYLRDQFEMLLQRGKSKKIDTVVHARTLVEDIEDDPNKGIVHVRSSQGESWELDHVVVCTGHFWPRQHEGKTPFYFDSPYPPSKLNFTLNGPVAIRGSSLTAIDAIRTFSRHHGTFSTAEDGRFTYSLHERFPAFRMVMHSTHGLLPAVRFHLSDSHLRNEKVLTKAEIQNHIRENDGFASLDFLFEKDFKELIRSKSPDFYKVIADLTLEEFVEAMMARREHADAFELLKAECAEAEQSIRSQTSIYWKEALAILSFSLNYPAKHFSAEDMQRLKETLMPLISVVIAFVPQSSAKELIALHEAGVLSITSVSKNSRVDTTNGEISYVDVDESGKEFKTVFSVFIDCIGQAHLSFDSVPLDGLKRAGSKALVQFKNGANARTEGGEDIIGIDGKHYLVVPGLAIDDNYFLVGSGGASNHRIAIMAVSIIGGFNPDYSGLDFCESASKKIAHVLIRR